MTIEAKLDETNRLLGILVGIASSPASAVTVPTPATPAKAPKAAKEKTSAPAPAPTPAVEPEADFDFDTGGEAAPEVKKLTVDDARKALVALQKAKGSAEASRGVLKANNLPSLASLKDDQQELIAKVIAGCAALLPKA